VRTLLRQSSRFFLIVSLAGLALRLLCLFRFPAVTSDSFIYGDIAKNWLQHGIYGISDDGRILPTLIRLPGYPAFLALVWRIFGLEHYRTVLVIQLFVDLGSCFLIADLARRLVSDRAAKAAFLLAALCPFFANYAAAALSETLEIFFTTLALDLALMALNRLSTAKVLPWLECGLAIGAAILLRPDGGLLLAALEIYLVWILLRRKARGALVFRAAVIVGVVSLAPLVPWTLRNLHTLHRFQPLAPRYANNEDEFLAGFNRWVKTWMADYVSVEEIYWEVPGGEIDPTRLPARTFDSPAQREATLAVLDEYNQDFHASRAVDSQFERLAEERIHAAPLRYYVWLPLLRLADIWLRPRTEILPSDTRWWEFNDDPKWSALAVALGVIGLLYPAAAVAGLVRGKFAPHLGLLLTFLVLRTAFLSTIANPEPRYTLECYPVVIVLASALSCASSRNNHMQ